MSAYRVLLTNTTRARVVVPATRHHAQASRQYSSPIKVFLDTIKEQMHKNKDINKSAKTLQDEAGRVHDSEALKKAKEMFEKAKVIKSDTSGRGDIK